MFAEPSAILNVVGGDIESVQSISDQRRAQMIVTAPLKYLPDHVSFFFFDLELFTFFVKLIAVGDDSA